MCNNFSIIHPKQSKEVLWNYLNFIRAVTEHSSVTHSSSESVASAEAKTLGLCFALGRAICLFLVNFPGGLGFYSNLIGLLQSDKCTQNSFLNLCIFYLYKNTWIFLAEIYAN